MCMSPNVAGSNLSPSIKFFLLENPEYVFHENWYTTVFEVAESIGAKIFKKFLQDKIEIFVSMPKKSYF